MRRAAFLLTLIAIAVIASATLNARQQRATKTVPVAVFPPCSTDTECSELFGE